MDARYEVSKKCTLNYDNCEECSEKEYCMLCCHHCKKIIGYGNDTMMCVICGEEVCIECGNAIQKDENFTCPEYVGTPILRSEDD